MKARKQVAVGLAAMALAGGASFVAADLAMAHTPAVTCANGTTLTLTGKDFPANATGGTATLFVDGKAAETIQGVSTDSTGHLVPRAFTTPGNAASHTYSVRVSGIDGNFDSAVVTMTCGTVPPPPPVVTTPPPTVTTPPPVVTTPPPVRRRVPPPPPAKKAPPCKIKVRIFQQQKGTLFTNTYPIRVRIGPAHAALHKGALILTDSGLQNFVAPDGSRTERLVIPVGPMKYGQVRTIRRTMGFVGPQAFKALFTTFATYHVDGRVCGLTQDLAFEG